MAGISPKLPLFGLLLGVSASIYAAPIAGEIKADSLKGKRVTFASHGGIFQEGQLAALDQFKKRTGVTLYSEGPAEIAKLKAQVESGRTVWDVVDVGDMEAHAYCGKYFEKLDFSRIDTSKIPAGQIGECSVPAMNYGVLFLYKTSQYKNHPPSQWKDFFDIKTYPGTRAIYGSPSFTPGFLEQAMIAAGADPKHFKPEDIAKGIEFLRARRDHIIFWHTGAQSQQMLESGEADFVLAWSGRAMAASANGAPFTPVWNDWFMSMDNITIAKGSKNIDAAYDLINAYLGARAQEILSEKTSYAPINTEAQPTLTQHTKQWLTSTPELAPHAYHHNVAFWTKNYDLAVEQWSSFITGY